MRFFRAEDESIARSDFLRSPFMPNESASGDDVCKIPTARYAKSVGVRNLTGVRRMISTSNG